MSHEFESGFLVKHPAWHGLGKVLEKAPETSKEAIELAGLSDAELTELAQKGRQHKEQEEEKEVGAIRKKHFVS